MSIRGDVPCERGFVNVVLPGSELGWLHEADLCAHCKAQPSVGGQLLVGPADGEFTVSAAGLFLLRTLEADHVSGDALTDENQLFPCCGFLIYWANETCRVAARSTWLR